LSGLYFVTTVVRYRNRLGARTTDNSTGGIKWSEDESLCDLDFADDIALIDDS